MKRLTYSKRAKRASHPLAKTLLHLMNEKQSNLCVSLDLTESHRLLSLADAIGPYVCMVKTHVDILADFSIEIAHALKALSEKHQFLIFEDRKFADIGNTVSLQYGKGLYHIADWAHIVNAHVLPGPGIIEGLKKVGLPKNRALLLLAEMSSQGHLMDQVYQYKTLQMAKAHQDFVIGFIAQHQLDPDFLTLTPGVNLDSAGDSLGQQYVSPEQAVKNGSDIVIVGRGIYAAENPAVEAQRYQTAAWQCYEKLV
jgi:orotidine 5'-phosphate decarboxylase subfamily 1